VSAEAGWQAARSQENSLQTRLLPAAKVANLLQRHMLRHRADRARRVPIAVIARMADVSRETAYQAARSRMGEVTRARLSAVLSWIEDGTLKVGRRIGQVWPVDYRTAPDPLPPPQDKCVRAEAWNEWARCRSCGGCRYTRVTLHGTDAEWYLCDGCLSWGTAGMGARPVEARRRRREASCSP
jgi:hypothetical protein